MRDIQVFIEFANSWISAPLTLILKSSSTKSAELRKSVLGVGGDGRNGSEPVGKHEVDGVDDGGGYSGDFNKKFHPRLQYGSHATHLNAKDKLINKVINQRGLSCSQV